MNTSGSPIHTAAKRGDIAVVKFELENGETAKGPTIDVRPARDQSFTEKLFGDVNPIIGSAVLLIVISIIVTALMWAKKATTRRGSRSEYDWDCLLYTSPSPRDRTRSRMPSSA